MHVCCNIWTLTRLRSEFIEKLCSSYIAWLKQIIFHKFLIYSTSDPWPRGPITLMLYGKMFWNSFSLHKYKFLAVLCLPVIWITFNIFPEAYSIVVKEYFLLPFHFNEFVLISVSQLELLNWCKYWRTWTVANTSVPC